MTERKQFTGVRISPEERKILERAAARDRMRFTAWVREAALIAARAGMRVKRQSQLVQ